MTITVSQATPRAQFIKHSPQGAIVSLKEAALTSFDKMYRNVLGFKQLNNSIQSPDCKTYQLGKLRIEVNVQGSEKPSRIEGIVLPLSFKDKNTVTKDHVLEFIEEQIDIQNTKYPGSAEQIQYFSPYNSEVLHGIEVGGYKFFLQSHAPNEKKQGLSTGVGLHHAAFFCNSLEQASLIQSFTQRAFSLEPGESYTIATDKDNPFKSIDLKVQALASQGVLINTITSVQPSENDLYSHLAYLQGSLTEYLQAISNTQRLFESPPIRGLQSLIDESKNLKQLPTDYDFLQKAQDAGLTLTTSNSHPLTNSKKNSYRIQHFISVPGIPLIELVHEKLVRGGIPFAIDGGATALNVLQTMESNQ